MNKCKKVLFFMTTVYLGIFFTNKAFSLEKHGKNNPLIHIDMEDRLINNSVFSYEFYGRDSISEGISGKAKYFSSEKGNPAHILLNPEESLSKLWENLDFSVEVWVQITDSNNEYQVIASNKDWNSGKTKDFTTNHEFGVSRTTGSEKGWAVICQPDGSWVWNIWHGGRRHGREIGPQQVIDFIKDTGTDIVMMQETYGSGALIADALGYYFYLPSTNISVISKYPIVETQPVYDAFRCGLTTIQISKSQKINLASLWIHYLPGWRSDSRDEGATADKLIKGEEKTRHTEIKEIVQLLAPYINETDDIPFIIGGDFNSPSHKDWIEEASIWHHGLVVEWPVSKVMMEAGFSDSFREIRSNINYQSTTMSAERLTYRIDYIYYQGSKVRAVDSDMHFKYKGIWPSDHPAITTTMAIK